MGGFGLNERKIYFGLCVCCVMKRRPAQYHSALIFGAYCYCCNEKVGCVV